jgi:ribonuclease E
VPPELEEMLRAELARKGGAPRTAASAAPVPAATDVEAKPRRRTSTRKPAATETAAEPTAELDATSAFGPEAKPKRRTSARKAPTTEA